MNGHHNPLADMTPAEYEQHKRERALDAVRERAAPFNARELTPQQWADEKRRLGIR